MRALLVCPEFPLSFWSFKKSCQLRGNLAVNPPLGLLTVAALLPPEWELRLVDLNTRSLTEEDWQWADLILISAMYIQREGLLALIKEAKRRGTQKSILERTAPPTFNIVVEIQERRKVAIHTDVAEAVDALLRGQPEDTEIRSMDENGEITITKETPAAAEAADKKTGGKAKKPHEEKHPKIYLFGVNRVRLEQMAKDMRISLDIVNNPNHANIFITSKAYYRNRPQKMLDAESANIPVYVLKSF